MLLGLRLIGLLLLLFISLPTSQAAQEAIVGVDEAPVRAEPNHDAAVLEFKSLGSPIRISSYAREGWFKIRSTKGDFGWIWQADVVVPTSRADAKAANMDFIPRPDATRKQRGEPWLFFRAGPKFVAGLNGGLGKKIGLGDNHFYPHLGGYFEVAFRVDDGVRLALRAEYLSLSQKVTYFTTEYDLAQTTYPFYLGVDVDVIRGETFDFGGGVYFGGYSNSFTLTATNFPTPNAFTVEQFNYTFLINFTGRYWISQRVAFVGEIGAHIAPASPSQIKANFNGSQPFLTPEGELGTVKPYVSGGFLSAALQVAF